MKFTEADKILKNTYLFLVNDRVSGKKTKLKSSRVVCSVCGCSNKTLRKIANGYICNDCLKRGIQNER